MPENGDRRGRSEAGCETVIGFLKDKLPAPIAGQIDGILANPDLGKQAGNVLGGFLRR